MFILNLQGCKGKSNTKCVDWSIKNDYITDYNIIVLNMMIYIQLF